VIWALLCQAPSGSLDPPEGPGRRSGPADREPSSLARVSRSEMTLESVRESYNSLARFFSSYCYVPS
jgi:hypothetical protein